MSSPTKAVADAADKSGGSSFFRFDGRKRTGIDHILRKSGAFDTDDAVFRLSGDGNDIEVNGGSEHLPIVVVGMVAADFASSGYRENGKRIRFSVKRGESIDGIAVPCAHGVPVSSGVQLFKKCICFLKKTCFIEPGVFSRLLALNGFYFSVCFWGICRGVPFLPLPAFPALGGRDG